MALWFRNLANFGQRICFVDAGERHDAIKDPASVPATRASGHLVLLAKKAWLSKIKVDPHIDEQKTFTLNAFDCVVKVTTWANESVSEA